MYGPQPTFAAKVKRIAILVLMGLLMIVASMGVPFPPSLRAIFQRTKGGRPPAALVVRQRARASPVRTVSAPSPARTEPGERGR